MTEQVPRPHRGGRALRGGPAAPAAPRGDARKRPLRTAGGTACRDVVAVSVRFEGADVTAARFDGEGSGTSPGCGGAAIALVADRTLLDAARVRADNIAAELDASAPASINAAELVAAFAVASTSL